MNLVYEVCLLEYADRVLAVVLLYSRVYANIWEPGVWGMS